MGSGTYDYGHPDSRTIENQLDQANIAPKRLSIGQPPTLKSILRLLPIFSSNLKDYISNYIEILSISDISAFKVLKSKLIDYQTRMKPIEDRLKKILDGDAQALVNHDTIITQLKAIKNDLQAVCQAIEKNVDTSFDNEDDLIQSSIKASITYIDTCRKIYTIDLKRLESAFNEYDNSHRLSARIAAAKAEFDEKFGVHRENLMALHRKDVAETRFESILDAFGNQETTTLSKPLEISEVDPARLLKRVCGLSMKAANLNQNVQSWDDKIIGFDIKWMQSVFQKQYDVLAECRETLQDNTLFNITDDCSVPNLTNLFADSLVSLRDNIKIGLTLWQGHFELNGQSIPADFHRLEEALHDMESLWEPDEWGKNGKDPTWDIHTLLDAIGSVLFVQQSLVLNQRNVLHDIKDLILDERLTTDQKVVNLVGSINATSLLLGNNSAPDTSSLESTSPRASFFGSASHHRYLSDTSMEPGLSISPKSSELGETQSEIPQP